MTGEISASVSTFTHSSSSTLSLGPDGSLSAISTTSLTATHDSFTLSDQGTQTVQSRRISSTRNQGMFGNPLMRGLFGGGCLGGAGLLLGFIMPVHPIMLLALVLLGVMLGIMLGGHGAQPCHEEDAHGALAQGGEGMGASLEITQSILRVQGRIVPPAPAIEEDEDISDANTPPATPVETPPIPELNQGIVSPEIPTHIINPYSESTEVRSIFPPHTGRLMPPNNNITHVTFTPDSTAEEPNPQEQTTAIPDDGLVVGNIRIFRNGTFQYEGGSPTLSNNRITLLNGSNNPVLRVNIQDQ